MSFWGGFVEGFATTAKEEIDLDVAKTDKIVNDTVKIGVQKALDTQEEIKADKKRIKNELEMLVNLKFSLPKAASIVKAGLTSTMAKYATSTKYRDAPDKLWDGTTKFAQDNKLTIQDVVNKLSYQPPLDYGNLKVGATQNTLLSALGLAPDIDSRIQSGIQTRVGTLDTGVDRSDISILPGSMPLEAKKQFDTTKTKNIDQRILELEEKRITPEGLSSTEDILLDRLKRIKAPTFEKQFVMQQKGGGASVMPSLDELKALKEKADNGDADSRNLLKGYLENYSGMATKKQYNDLIKKLR